MTPFCKREVERSTFNVMRYTTPGKKQELHQKMDVLADLSEILTNPSRWYFDIKQYSGQRNHIHA